MHIKNMDASSMATKIRAKQVLTTEGWRSNMEICVDEQGVITGVEKSPNVGPYTFGTVLPALSNLHSHSFQRAMSGLAETRGPDANDDFWSWRNLMYRFLVILTPEDFEAIAALSLIHI